MDRNLIAVGIASARGFLRHALPGAGTHTDAVPSNSDAHSEHGNQC